MSILTGPQAPSPPPNCRAEEHRQAGRTLPRVEKPMSVRSLCLAILSFGDATGYEIRKESTEGRFSYFDDASFGSIYPALARLESEGLVTVREEPQTGKPARKVYSITETGRTEFVNSLCEPQARDTFKSPFLLIALNGFLMATASPYNSTFPSLNGTAPNRACASSVRPEP